MRLRVFQEEVKTVPCLALVIVEFGRSESSRPSAWAELGSLGATYCPFNTVVPRGGGSPEHWMERETWAILLCRILF